MTSAGVVASSAAARKRKKKEVLLRQERHPTKRSATYSTDMMISSMLVSLALAAATNMFKLSVENIELATAGNASNCRTTIIVLSSIPNDFDVINVSDAHPKLTGGEWHVPPQPHIKPDGHGHGFSADSVDGSCNIKGFAQYRNDHNTALYDLELSFANTAGVASLFTAYTKTLKLKQYVSSIGDETIFNLQLSM